jgi:hypothetical protein
MFSGLRADLTKAFSFNPLYVLRKLTPSGTVALTMEIVTIHCHTASFLPALC